MLEDENLACGDGLRNTLTECIDLEQAMKKSKLLIAAVALSASSETAIFSRHFSYARFNPSNASKTELSLPFENRRQRNMWSSR